MIERGQHIHFLGIGGIGMCALAELLNQRGCRVTGSDAANNAHIERLQKQGVVVQIGHVVDAVLHADVVVYSSAISKENPEFKTAIERQVPMWSRGQLLAEFMKAYDGIAIAGTHGKTTTTALAAALCRAAELDASYAIGGVIKGQESPVYLGSGQYFVAEADESDASFLYMSPKYVIVTNIDQDHLETYQGDYERLKAAFIQFINQLPEDGVAIVCLDDSGIVSILPFLKRRVLTYGFHSDADIRIVAPAYHGRESRCTVKRSDGAEFTIPKFNLPGRHNLSNAMAVVALAHVLGVDNEIIQAVFATFPGVGRRFHEHGEVKINQMPVQLMEDYGHHPKEMAVTFDAIRLAWPSQRVIMVFQPHRYSRTRDLLQDFVHMLSQVDVVVLMEIYAAGEDPIPGVSSALLQDQLIQSGKSVILAPDLPDVVAALEQTVQPDDVIVLQGAGNVGKLAEYFNKDSGGM